MKRRAAISGFDNPSPASRCDLRLLRSQVGTRPIDATLRALRMRSETAGKMREGDEGSWRGRRLTSCWRERDGGLTG
jgi:hypothetical protein